VTLLEADLDGFAGTCYSGHFKLETVTGIGNQRDHTLVTSLCPGGKERMRRLLEMVRGGHFDPAPLVTHRFRLDQIAEAYDLFSNRRDGVLKVAITP